MQINFPRHSHPYPTTQLRPKVPQKFTADEIQSMLHPPKPTLIDKFGNFADKTAENVLGPLAAIALIIGLPLAIVASQEEGKAQKMEMEILHKTPDKVGYFMKKGNEYQNQTGTPGMILATRQNFYTSVLDSLDGGKSTPLNTFFKAAKK